MQNNEEIMNIKELCSWLHISQSMVRKLIYENKIPTFCIGNRYYFSKKIINKWILNKHNSIDIGGFDDGNTGINY